MSGPDEGTDDRPATGADAERPSADADTPELAPIPVEGTDAPADASRVFGSPQSRPGGPGRRALGGPPGPAPGGRQDQGWASQPTPGTGPAFPAPGSAPGPGSGPAPDRGQPPTEEQARRIRNRGRLALIFGIGGLISSVLAFPLGLLLGIAALAMGIVSRRAGGRAGMPVPGAVPGIVLGTVATVIASVVTVVAAMFWSEITTYQECMSGANTQTARDGCRAEFEDQVFRRVLPASRN